MKFPETNVVGVRKELQPGGYCHAQFSFANIFSRYSLTYDFIINRDRTDNWQNDSFFHILSLLDMRPARPFVDMHRFYIHNIKNN